MEQIEESIERYLAAMVLCHWLARAPVAARGIDQEYGYLASLDPSGAMMSPSKCTIILVISER
jgi:hypothetical protein